MLLKFFSSKRILTSELHVTTLGCHPKAEFITALQHSKSLRCLARGYYVIENKNSKGLKEICHASDSSLFCTVTSLYEMTELAIV